MFQWIRKIGCVFGFHGYIPIREEWLLYRQRELYLENQDYMKQGENIVSVIYCPHCGDRIDIKIKK